MVKSQTSPSHDQKTSKCLAKWIWLQHLGGASPSKFGGASLETLSGEAQLKKTPCSSDNTNMIIFFLIRVSVKWGAYLTPFPPVQISDTDNAWTTILRHLEASRGRGLQMQSHLWLENSIASNHLRWGILLARLEKKLRTKHCKRHVNLTTSHLALSTRCK